MELEIGNYARINEDSRAVCLGIGKITNIVQDTVYLQMDKRFNMPISFQKNQIANASHNLIDLIDQGDIISYTHSCRKEPYTELIVTKESLEMYKKFIKEESIILKSIVTKEQFGSMKYDIGG